MPLIDDASFTAMVEAWAPHLYRTAAWLGADRATAEDLVQETLLRAWNARRTLRDGASARAWLVTILRRESARRFERIQPPPGKVDPDDLAYADPACPTLEALVVRAAVAALAPMYREPLVLQGVWGMSCAEIAEAMRDAGYGLKAMAKSLGVSRATLQRRMEEAGQWPKPSAQAA